MIAKLGFLLIFYISTTNAGQCNTDLQWSRHAVVSALHSAKVWEAVALPWGREATLLPKGKAAAASIGLLRSTLEVA